MGYRCNHRLSETCQTCIAEQWQMWRDDYRCARPPVSCEGCDTFYPSHKDAGMMIFEGFRLVQCSECQRQKRIKKSLRDHFQARLASLNGIRKIHRDIAVRYIERFGGSTFAVQTEIDDCEIYLRNAFGLAIAQVLSTDRYPTAEKPIEDIPY